MTPTTPSDEEIERDWRAGARSAFAELFRRHYPAVVAYALRFLGDLAAAEDVVQQAFLNILQRRRGGGRFKALLYTTVRNLALNERRRQGRRYVARAGLADTADLATADPPPWSQLVAEEERRSLGRALDALDEDEREAFLLHEREGLTYQEIGQVMNLHQDAVRRRVARALRRVRERLDGEGSGE